MKTIVTALTAAVLGAWLVPALPVAAQKDKDTPKGSGDQKFVQEAAETDATEIALAQLAMKNAASGDVKAFAQHMIKDHTKSTEELMQIVSKKGFPAPKSVGDKPMTMVKKMADKKGAEFDKAYMKQMVEDHKKVLAKVQKASKDLQDPDLRAFAAKLVPVVSEHLRHAEMICNVVEKDTKGGGK